MLRHTRRLTLTGLFATGFVVTAGIVATAQTTSAAKTRPAVVRTRVHVTPSARTLNWGGSVRLVARLSGPAGPVIGRPVSFWDRASAREPWREVASLTTDTHGSAAIVVEHLRSSTQWQGRYEGDLLLHGGESPTATVWVLPPRPSTTAFGIRVVKEAARHKGAPYQWGAEGPDRFDCSGFTHYVFAKFGVSLPRTAQDQYDAVSHIPRDRKQLGDLVFFGYPGSIHHVGIYAGNDQMWAATQTGDYVRLESISGHYYLVGRVH